MTINELKNTVMGISGAVNGRANKTNFIVIPVEGGYAKVSISETLAKDTKNHKAFNYDAVVAEYKAWEAESALREAEKANKPKKVSGPNPEAQARRDALDATIRSLPAFTNATATDVLAMIPDADKPKTVMLVGSALKRLIETGEVVVGKAEDPTDKKSYYSKA